MLSRCAAPTAVPLGVKLVNEAHLKPRDQIDRKPPPSNWFQINNREYCNLRAALERFAYQSLDVKPLPLLLFYNFIITQSFGDPVLGFSDITNLSIDSKGVDARLFRRFADELYT